MVRLTCIVRSMHGSFKVKVKRLKPYLAGEEVPKGVT